MKRDLKIWQFAGFASVSLLGTLLHFLYDFTDSTFTALFSAVNESTWEHMKLIFFPMVLFAVVESFFIGKEYKNFWCIKLKGIIIGLLLIPVLFYTLGGIFGSTPDFINIAIFFVSAAVTFIYETNQFEKEEECDLKIAVFIILGLITAAFFVFTFNTPKIPLFQDPISGGFGL